MLPGRSRERAHHNPGRALLAPNARPAWRLNCPSQTHNISLTSPLAEFVLSMGPNGRVKSKGHPSEVLPKDPELAEELAADSDGGELDESDDEVQEEEAADPKEGKLVIAEEIAVGSVSWNACKFICQLSGCSIVHLRESNVTADKLFLGNLAGALSFLFWIAYLGGEVFVELCDVLEMWWLAWWAGQYAIREHERVNALL